MAKKKNRKVVRYRRPLNINVGMIIFALIFLYMAFYLYTYLRRDKVEFYEVVEGSIVNDTRHTGIIFRTEEPKYTIPLMRRERFPPCSRKKRTGL